MRSFVRSVLAGTMVALVNLAVPIAHAATPDLSSCNEWRLACSSNFTASSRPGSYPINYVVIHKVQGSAASAASWFQNCSANVSAHYTYNNSTGYCYQSVREKDLAWHAGNWTYNTQSVGIEHGGYVTSNDTATACYDNSALETRSCILYYSVLHNRSRIVGHNEVPGASHTDPGSYWNWGYYMTKCAPVTTSNPSYYFDSSSQGWSNGSNSITSAAWQAPGGWPGIIYGDQTGNDAFWLGPDTNYTGGADPCVNVQVYPQNGNSGAHDMQLFWRTADSNSYSSDKASQLVSYNQQNGWYSVNLSMNSAKYWYKNITGWRLDLDNTNNGTRFIINHMVLQQTPRYWFASGTDGWSSVNGLTGLAHQADAFWGDIIYCDQTANDPHIARTGFNFLGAKNDRIRIRLYPQNGNTASHDIQAFFKTNADNTWTADKSTPVVNYTAQNNWIDVTLNPSGNAKWSGNYINSLRIDFDQANHGNRWIVDHIMIDHASN